MQVEYIFLSDVEWEMYRPYWYALLALPLLELKIDETHLHAWRHITKAESHSADRETGDLLSLFELED